MTKTRDYTYLYCKKCKNIKHQSYFYQDKRYKSGHQSYCKECNDMISNKKPSNESLIKLPADVDKFINAAITFYQENPVPVSDLAIPSEDALDSGKCVSLSEHPWVVDTEMSNDGMTRVPRYE